MTAMRPADQLRALTAAEQFIRTQMTTVDLVSILRYQGGSVDILQDFTADRNRLLSILETLIVGEGQGSAETIDDASSADTGAAFGQDDSEFNVFNTDRQLSALQTAAKMLGQLNEKKSLIYFASGLRLNGIDNQAQLHATVDAAISAGVSFWPIDARGLVAEAPLGDATQGSPGQFRHVLRRCRPGHNHQLPAVAGHALRARRRHRRQGSLRQQRSDPRHCSGAGGDLRLLHHRLLHHQHGQERTFPPGQNLAHARRWREPELPPGLLRRQGVQPASTAVDKERQLEDALMLEDPITELSIAMEIDHFQLNRAEYFVPIVVKIPGRELALAKRGGAEHTLIDFVGEIKDLVGGTTVTNVRDNVNIKLSDATAAELAQQAHRIRHRLHAAARQVQIKFLARDDETGQNRHVSNHLRHPESEQGESAHIPSVP